MVTLGGLREEYVMSVGVPRLIPSLRRAFVREQPGRAFRCKSSPVASSCLLAMTGCGLSAAIAHAE